MKVLSKEDGYNPQCGIIDSGMVARPQPLLMIITTAGFDLGLIDGKIQQTDK